jgi:hypothetical protein
MPKQAISVTLDRDNLLWLRARARAARRRSVSEALDQLVSEARTGARAQDGSIRSVVGTISIAADDPGLTSADAVVRALFSRRSRLLLRTKPRSVARRKRKREGRRG